MNSARLRRVMAIAIVTVVAVLPFIWNPWGGGAAQESVEPAGSVRLERAFAPTKACPRDERCFFIRMAERFRALSDRNG